MAPSLACYSASARKNLSTVDLELRHDPPMLCSLESFKIRGLARGFGGDPLNPMRDSNLSPAKHCCIHAYPAIGLVLQDVN